MSELVGAIVIRVTKPNRLGEGLDGRLIAGQEMPSLGGARARVQSHVNPLLVGREARSFARIEA